MVWNYCFTRLPFMPENDNEQRRAQLLTLAPKTLKRELITAALSTEKLPVPEQFGLAELVEPTEGSS